MDYRKSNARKVTMRPLHAAGILAFLSIIALSCSPYFARADAVIRASQDVTVTAIVGTPNTGGTGGSTGGTTSSGGGGGGGGSSPASTQPVAQSPTASNAVFKGLAYPGSIVTLYKNGVTAAEVPASPDATFQISLEGLSGGTYNFGVKAEDSEGRYSPLQVYTVTVTTGVTTLISGIFFPPTVGLDKTQVRRGDVLTVFGHTVPKASVTAVFNSATNLVKKTVADEGGSWVYKLDTLELEYGNHEVKVRSQTDTDITSFSPSLAFTVGSLTKVNPVQTSGKGSLTGDVNHDGKVDIIDFSIEAYWYNKPNPVAVVDLNNDGKVTLADFSIMAYHWTGS